METSSHGPAPRTQPLLHEKTSDWKVAHTYKHILAHDDTFADSPGHIIKPYSFFNDEMSYAAGVQQFC